MQAHAVIISFFSLVFTVSDLRAQDTVPADSAGVVLVINACDPNGFHARKKKEALFMELADTLNVYLSDNLQTRYGFTVKPLQLRIPDDGNRNAVVDSLLTAYHAGYAVLFDSLDVFFQQTRVDVSGTKGNKERIAYYDICADIHYLLFSPGSMLKTDMNKTREFFTTRKVISGLLAAGPDIVSKKKHAIEMMEKNAHGFLWGIETYLPPGH